MEIFANTVDCIFAKHSILSVSQGRCASGKTKEKVGALSFFLQNIRTSISADFLDF